MIEVLDLIEKQAIKGLQNIEIIPLSTSGRKFIFSFQKLS